MSIRAFYDRWPQHDRRLTEVVGAMTDEHLAIRPAPERWPIWATGTPPPPVSAGKAGTATEMDKFRACRRHYP